MYRVASLIYSIVSTSLAGTLIVVALVAGYDTGRSILLAAAIGFSLAIPVAWLVARQIVSATSKPALPLEEPVRQ